MKSCLLQVCALPEERTEQAMRVGTGGIQPQGTLKQFLRPQNFTCLLRTIPLLQPSTKLPVPLVVRSVMAQQAGQKLAEDYNGNC